MRAFDQGKNLYTQGMPSEAIAEWKKITPWVEDGEAFQKELQKLEASAQEWSRQNSLLKEARAKSSSVYAAPDELARVIQTANTDLKNQTQAATNERLLIQQNWNDKQARISGLLYKASLALKAGKIDQALAEWEKLLPYLDAATLFQFADTTTAGNSAGN